MFNVCTIISRIMTRFSRGSSPDGPDADTLEDTP